MVVREEEPVPSAAHAPLVPRAVDRLAAWSWRVLVVIGALSVLLWLIGQLWVVSLAVFVAVILSRVLDPVVAALRGRGWRDGPAAVLVLIGFLAVLTGAASGIAVLVAGEMEQIGPTIGAAIDDLEGWVVNDSPLPVDQGDVDGLRDDAGAAIAGAFRASGGPLLSGALQVFEVIVSLFLALLLTFFMLKDGRTFLAWCRSRLPARRVELGDRLARRGWRTLGGYLRGAALLGAVEGVIIGITLEVVGADLAVPMALVTFLSAFVPIVGALVAGALATLVALGTAGTTAALVVLVVAVIVQQVDNEVLAPVVYGRSLDLHPVWILLAVAAGSALFGVAGSLTAVPITAVLVNVASEAWTTRAPDLMDRHAPS